MEDSVLMWLTDEKDEHDPAEEAHGPKTTNLGEGSDKVDSADGDSRHRGPIRLKSTASKG
jgi:hypothetical protein